MADLTLTVLGSSPAWPNPDGACSGYLVAAGDTHVLLECGTGVAARVMAALPLRNLDAVVVSHMHADHFIDLVPLRQAIRHGKLGGERPIQVWLPPGGEKTLAALRRALSGNDRFFSGTFELREYQPNTPLRLGPLGFSFRRVRHAVPSYAMRIDAGRVLAFSADSAPCDELLESARGADTLLCEAAIGDVSQDDPKPERRSHCTAREAGEIARRAGVGQLILTHCRIDPADPEKKLREARAAFSGPVELAREGQRYEI